MARSLQIALDHHARTLSGTAVLSRVVLAGWGAVTAGVPALEAFTDRGRLWWKFTAASNLLELFRRATMGGGDRVAYTTVAAANGKATLVQDTSSGFSGSCDIDDGTEGVNPAANAYGDLIVSYAHENDLVDVYADAGGYLDENSKWYAQGTRFEALLRMAKRELDERLVEKLNGDLERDDMGRRALAVIADPRQLATIHALMTAYKLDGHRAGSIAAKAETAQWHLDRALSLLRATRVVLDLDADGAADTERRSADRVLGRS